MKKRYIIILIIPCLILVKLLFAFTINEVIITKYNKGNYNETLINSLYFLNLSEPYIAYYNHGNILYRKDNYKEAITKYENALEKNPPKNKVCNIRINLSLSITATIDKNNKQDALSKIKKAKDTLYEDNCARAGEDKGESEEAEKLEQELKKLEEEIKGNEEENNEENNNSNEENNNKQDEKNIEEQLKENQKNSSAARQDDLNYNENRNVYYDGISW